MSWRAYLVPMVLYHPTDELVRFKAIHCAIILVLAFLLDIPHVVHDSARVAYPVNKGGIVLVTGKVA